MSDIVKGRGVRVELGATYDTAKAISAVTLASPGVATRIGHGFADAAVGYLDNVVGMAQLNQQAVRVDAPATDTFALQGINTTSYPAWVSGDFFKVLTWVTLAEATAYTIGGGAPSKLDVSTLLDVVQQLENGLLAAQSFSLKVLAKTTPTAALALVSSSAQSSQKLVIRVTHPDGAVRVAYGEPSLPGEDVQQGAVGTGTLEFSVRGLVLLLAP